MPLTKFLKKVYDEKYREEHRERARINYRRMYADNKVCILQRNKEWREKTGYKSRCNTKELRVIIINLLLQRDGDLCGECGDPLNEDYSIDHKLPICCGGDESANNIQLTHKLCNIRKRRKKYG